MALLDEVGSGIPYRSLGGRVRCIALPFWTWADLGAIGPWNEKRGWKDLRENRKATGPLLLVGLRDERYR